MSRWRTSVIEPYRVAHFMREGVRTAGIAIGVAAASHTGAWVSRVYHGIDRQLVRFVGEGLEELTMNTIAPNAQVFLWIGVAVVAAIVVDPSCVRGGVKRRFIHRIAGAQVVHVGVQLDLGWLEGLVAELAADAHEVNTVREGWHCIEFDT